MPEANDNHGRPVDAASYPEKWYDPEPATLAEPTYWPIILAVGITLLAWGVVTSYLLSILGFGMAVVAIVNWIGDLRREQKNEPEKE
jgi:hypothetical protein